MHHIVLDGTIVHYMVIVVKKVHFGIGLLNNICGQICSEGKYKEENGQGTCKDCPIGKTSHKKSSNCGCLSGYYGKKFNIKWKMHKMSKVNLIIKLNK